MPHDAEKYLYDIVDACEFLQQFTQGKDRGFRSAVERELQNIGEALFQLNRTFPRLAARISEYDRIIRFRHVLVHDYGSLDAQLVWYVIEDKLTLLKSEAEALQNAVVTGRRRITNA